MQTAKGLMTEILDEAIRLRVGNNRRASLMGLILPASLCGLGGALVLAGRALPASVNWLGWPILGLGTGLAGLGLVIAVGLVYWMQMPRLSYRDGFLLIYLSTTAPQRVPLEVVECFFMGQGPGAGPWLGQVRPEATNLVVRIAERAETWHRRDVRPALGSWCDGYITIRGMWCEPLGLERINELNQALKMLKRAQDAEPGRVETIAEHGDR